MMARGAALVFLQACLCAERAKAQTESTWHLVDTAYVLCEPKRPLTIQVSIPNGVPDKDRPHVITFYRQSSQQVSITFEAKDSMGSSVVPRTTVDLEALTGRRLGALNGSWASVEVQGPVAPSAATEEDEVFLDGSLYEDDYADTIGMAEVEEEELSGQPRQLRSSGGRGSSSFSSSRSRTTSSGYSSTSSSRSTASATSPRRRANPASARRRGAPASSNQPMTGVGGSRFENKNGQSYGYTSQSNLNSNFGGRPPAATSYGYSGAGAYKASSSFGSTSRIALAAAGGAVVGFGAVYMFSRLNSYCRYDDFTGSCQDCYRSYSQSNCRVDRPMNDLNRDDLMQTGFWPADFIGPITVTIFNVVGHNFVPSSFCPPPDWDITKNITVGAIDIYMTLTQIQELGDELAKDEESEVGGFMGVISSILSILCCCACIGAIVMIIMKSKRAQQQQSTGWEGGQQDYDYGGGGLGGTPAYAQPYQPQYGQQQYGYGQPQYGQPYGQTYAQPVQSYQGGGPIVMGQAVSPPEQVVEGQALPSGYRPGQY